MSQFVEDKCRKSQPDALKWRESVSSSDNFKYKDALDLPKSVDWRKKVVVTQGIFDGQCGSELDYGVAAVGYGLSKGTNYVIVKDPWGPKGGERGFQQVGHGAPSAALKFLMPNSTISVSISCNGSIHPPDLWPHALEQEPLFKRDLVHKQICNSGVFPISGQATPCCRLKTIIALSSSTLADHETLPPERSSLSHLRKSNPRSSSPGPTTSFLDKDPQYIIVLVMGSTGHIDRFVVKELIHCGFHIVSVTCKRSSIRDRKTKEDTLRDLHSSRICFFDLIDVVALNASLVEFCSGRTIGVGARE
ncbi:hypothetical protein ACLOJK_026712 [Asimina triloba]